MKKAELILAICVLATCTTFSVHASVDPLKYEEVPIILDKKDNIYEENGKMFIADKETLAVTDVQKNALEVVICIVEMKSGNIVKESPVKFLLPTKGIESVQIKNKWVSVDEKQGKKFKKAIPIIRKELGSSERREIFLKQIEYIIKHKKQNKKNKAKRKQNKKYENKIDITGVKTHGQVLTDKELESMKEKEAKKNAKSDDVVVTITEIPTVEIVSHDDVQVEITSHP